ncbi:hypothetical protein HYH03_006259 [Edaphochlamys debaryana]|uniref:Enoyl reductase (ER) domain-containing protein n=1 Tax=Edaphochlamys debaryana TaxID=47281 RepID=A0A835Y5R6_9CHLO|nr:hypothetical protein HYH03_006259 [Edaphochlamys debaryana]|eukprot:KAG2495659.1 hypothetical protein HYH03_006259 [Edaphochlamys debaryana]
MKAVVMTGFGPAHETLKFDEQHPAPVRKKGEVLVQVHASSVNPAEFRIRQGLMPKWMIRVPQILGVDIAGVVLEADEGSKFKPGDRVFGCTDQFMKDPWGTYAELCSARERLLAPIPPGVGFEEAACLGIAGMTAWQALAPSMPLEGKRVFVQGGAGGIGHFTVQIAKAQGACVATTCSARNADFVTQDLGADLAVDYTLVKDAFTLAPGEQPYDVVVDLVGAEPRSWGLLRRGGRMAAVSFDALMESRKAQGNSVLTAIVWRILKLSAASALGLLPGPGRAVYDAVQQSHEPDKGLVQLGDLVAAGKVKVHITQVVPLEGIADAHAECEKGHTRGKVAIRVRPE